MLEIGKRVFFQRPEEFSSRTLHPGEVLSFEQTACCVALDAPLQLDMDQSVLIYYEVSREFVQQPVRITIPPRPEPVVADSESEPGETTRLLVDFETAGFVMSAESRSCYRVTTVTDDLTARVGPEATCTLIDVSASGFSVIAEAKHAHGDILPATLCYEDREFTGTACVRSIKTLITGATRYGLTGIEAGRGSIGQGQERITMGIQRAQLRRQRGA